MGEASKIQWTDNTFNPWIGCHKVSEACKHCYAEVNTFARQSKAQGLPLWGQDAARYVTGVENWKKPLQWQRRAAKTGIRERVFCASLADIFEDFDGRVVGDANQRVQGLHDVRRKLWALIEETPDLDWQILTKRPENIVRFAPSLWLPGIATGQGGQWPHNVWIGTTAENQERADERLPHLLKIPAAVKFVSYEPALGPVDFFPWLGGDGDCCDCGDPECPGPGSRGCTAVRIDWLIIGGESGPGARPFDLAWARSAVEQMRNNEIPVFVKQMGARPVTHPDPLAPATQQTFALRDRKGGDMAEWPEDLRVREMPGSKRG